MQTSVDGFVDSDPGGPAWQLWCWSAPLTRDPRLVPDFTRTMDAASIVVLSRQTIEGGYLDHWNAMGDNHPDVPDFAFARRVAAIE